MPKAKFEAIYQSLKSRVEEGRYPYGQLMPSENELAAQFGCSRNTVRRALDGLAKDGAVQPIHGKGVRVIYQPAEKAAFTVGGIESFQETARRNRLHAVTRVVAFAETRADETLAARSGFPVGSALYHVERVRLLDGKARILDINDFLQQAVPGLTPEIAAHSIYDYLENTLGMQIATSRRTITVEHATEKDRQYLDMDGYDCLAVVTSQTFNHDGLLFEYTRSRHQPEQFCFQDTAIRK